jgi:F-type H+-transporting ATPase subunit b
VQRSRDHRVAARARLATRAGEKCGLALALVASAAGQASAAEGGLVLFPDWRFQLPLLVVFFATLVPLVNRLLLRPLLRVLDARAERTNGAQRRAARLVEEVRGLVERYEGAIADARRSADAARRDLIDQARQRAAEQTGQARAAAEQEIDRARHELGDALAGARASLRAQSAELAREAAARVLGRSVA